MTERRRSNPQIDRAAVVQARRSMDVINQVLPSDSVNLLAREVISRLAGRASKPAKGHRSDELLDALLQTDELAVMRIVHRMMGQGVPIEDIYLTHLGNVACRLGWMWEEDRLTSAQVTLAAGRIYTLMRGLATHLLPTHLPDGRHAVFAPLPGAKHVLGVKMAADLFRHDGWLIDLKLCASHDELVSELEQCDFRILGLSAGTSHEIPALTRLIAAVRIIAPHVQILVSGHLAQSEPRLKLMCDADAVAGDYETAQREVGAMWARTAPRARQDPPT